MEVSAMLNNRSMPSSGVIPVLAYPDVLEASKWLCAAFGFTERLVIGSHRIQLNAGSGAVVIVGGGAAQTSHPGISIMVRVADVRAHCFQAKSHGVVVPHDPTDFPYGERQYSAVDFAGYSWTFSQSIADVSPADWGGVLKDGQG
jgi:uncharacterized glyoxalase superfamily protein PhnB